MPKLSKREIRTDEPTIVIENHCHKKCLNLETRTRGGYKENYR